VIDYGNSPRPRFQRTGFYFLDIYDTNTLRNNFQIEVLSMNTIIAVYGVNNIGKTTQTQLLRNRLEDKFNDDVEYFKFPAYNILPSGPVINGYLREGNPFRLSAREFQLLQVQNRFEFWANNSEIISLSKVSVFEDYTGTGIAWGIGSGVDRDFLININSGLPKEDVSILLDGDRFIEAREEHHLHETNDALTEKVRKAHIELAEYFNWDIVDANQSINHVQLIAHHFLPGVVPLHWYRHGPAHTCPSHWPPVPLP